MLVKARRPEGASDWVQAVLRWQRGEPAEAEFFWPLSIVLTACVLVAFEWHKGAQAPPHRVTLDELRAWIAQTRSLAQRAPYGAEILQRMEDAANGLERVLDYPQRFCSRPPNSVSTQADYEFRCSLMLWATDRLIREASELERAHAQERHARRRTGKTQWLRYRPTQLWEKAHSMWKDEGDPPSWTSYPKAQTRIRRFAAQIRPGMEDALMREVLYDIEQLIKSHPSMHQPPGGTRTN